MGRQNVRYMDEEVVDVVPLAVSAEEGDDVHQTVADAVKKDGHGSRDGRVQEGTIAEYEEVVGEQVRAKTLS